MDGLGWCWIRGWTVRSVQAHYIHLSVTVDQLDSSLRLASHWHCVECPVSAVLNWTQNYPIWTRLAERCLTITENRGWDRVLTSGSYSRWRDEGVCRGRQWVKTLIYTEWHEEEEKKQSNLFRKWFSSLMRLILVCSQSECRSKVVSATGFWTWLFYVHKRKLTHAESHTWFISGRETKDDCMYVTV